MEYRLLCPDGQIRAFTKPDERLIIIDDFEDVKTELAAIAGYQDTALQFLSWGYKNGGYELLEICTRQLWQLIGVIQSLQIKQG